MAPKKQLAQQRPDVISRVACLPSHAVASTFCQKTVGTPAAVRPARAKAAAQSLESSTAAIRLLARAGASVQVLALSHTQSG